MTPRQPHTPPTDLTDIRCIAEDGLDPVDALTAEEALARILAVIAGDTVAQAYADKTRGERLRGGLVLGSRRLTSPHAKSANPDNLGPSRKSARIPPYRLRPYDALLTKPLRLPNGSLTSLSYSYLVPAPPRQRSSMLPLSVSPLATDLTYERALKVPNPTVLPDGAIVIGVKHWPSKRKGIPSRVGFSVLLPDGTISARHYDQEEN